MNPWFIQLIHVQYENFLFQKYFNIFHVTKLTSKPKFKSKPTFVFFCLISEKKLWYI